MSDAAYIANALWSNPTDVRIAKARRLCAQSGVPWESVEALRPSPVVEVTVDPLVVETNTASVAVDGPEPSPRRRVPATRKASGGGRKR